MAQMTQAETDAWIAAHGGAQLQHGVEQKRVPNPSYNEAKGSTPTNPQYIDIEVETWVNSKTGAKLSAKHAADGSWEMFETTDADPSKPASGSSTKPTNVYIGTNPSSGKQSQVSEYPDGHKEYDDTQVPAAQAAQGQTTNIEGTQRPDGSWDNEQPREVTRDTTGKVISSKPLEGTALKDWRESRERSRNPGGKTDAEVQAATTASQTAATTAATSRRLDSAEARAVAEANKVGSKVEDLVIQGQHYTKITKTSADGKTTVIEHYGPDGNQIARLPTEGEASVSTTPMPQIVAGHITEAITEYHKRLWSDPTLTPEQREKRFAEFVQVATATQNQANEQQRERESQRNADYNTASTKLTYLENSTQAALTFTQGLIGKVKAGSGLAGQAFAALMGLQALNMQASGINDLKSTVNSGQLALNNPEKLAEQTQQISAQVQQAATQTPTTTSATPSLGQGQDLSTPVVAPAAASTSSAVQSLPAATQTAAAAPSSPSAASSLGQGQDLSSPNGTTMTGATQTGMPPAITAEQAAAYDRGGINPATGDISVQDTSTSSVGAPDVAQPGDPGYGESTTGTTPVPPSQYGDSGDAQSRSQQSDWAALAALQQQQQATAQAQPQAEQTQQTDYSDSPALLHAQAASKPIWEMTEDEWRRYKAAGVPDSVIRSVPGRTAA